MNVERLKMLSDLLRKPVPVEGVTAFYMNRWSGNFYPEMAPVCQVFDDTNTCGTTCCALGLAGADPEFRKLGLFHDPAAWRLQAGGYPFVVDGEAVEGLDAAMRFFGIDRETAYCLFGGESWYEEAERVPYGDVVRTVNVADAIDYLIEHGELPGGAE